MHETTKIVDKEGTHILSSTLEADGPFEMASPAAQLDAKVIALRRTDSGGVFLQTAVTVTEPKAVVPEPVAEAEPEKSPEEQAVEYLLEKGVPAEEVTAALNKFGAAAILAKRNQQRHEELDALLSPPKAPKLLDLDKMRRGTLGGKPPLMQGPNFDDMGRGTAKEPPMAAPGEAGQAAPAEPETKG